MLGRQNHYLDARTLISMFERFGFSISEREQAQILQGPYSEELFRKLGARSVDSMDASDYEGASVIHDLNQPIPPNLHQQYTAVIDFGSLEHVFHFPNAIKNATDLLGVGGHFVSMSVANNFMGHGFYQFSPELFFSYLPANGFAEVEVYLAPSREFPFFFRVGSPRELGGRVELVNPEPIQIGVIAKKVEHLPEVVIPMQSDYEDRFWHGRDVSRVARKSSMTSHLKSKMSRVMKRTADVLRSRSEALAPQLLNGFENDFHYRLFDPAKEPDELLERPIPKKAAG